MESSFLKSNFKAYPEVDNQPVQSYKPLLCVSSIITISDGWSEKFTHSTKFSDFEENWKKEEKRTNLVQMLVDGVLWCHY